MLQQVPAPGTPLPFEKVLNFRELGGYPVAGGRRVRHGVFYRSATLNEITTPADVALYESLGLRYILDLRSRLEAQAAPDRIPAGARYEQCCAMRYLNGEEIDFSPEGMAHLAADCKQRAAELGRELSDFEQFVDLYGRMPFHNPAYQTLFAAMEAGETPLLFHCAAGKDRTGIAGMLILLALGADRETALQDYMQTNVCRRPIIDAYLARHQEEWDNGDEYTREQLISIEGVSPRLVRSTLEAIETRYPSYEAFFEAEYGLTPAHLARWREQFTE